ncbi:peroxide stress protein YaaA [Streptococcus merionis]|uniref:peroxide stress protein YaaA n=1 Tax=Streptococcus merionis TaxID=400065 RepID=UPI0026F04FEA|nr:peroxide stress protein YaaA [Streptococcus merionis]
MKILLPTAKEMNTKLPSQTMTALSLQSLPIVEAIASLSEQALVKHYKIKPEAVGLESSRWADLAQGTSQAYPAWQLFDGLMYRQIKRENLSDKAQVYLSRHAFITSALYGVINVFDSISPHRLDFLMGFKVNGQSLKSYWREAFDQAVAEDDFLISLLSSEFETVFSKVAQDKMVKLVFMENKAGQLKTHSTISKKARGKCLNALVDNQVTSLEQIKQLQFDGFSYREKLSKERTLVFVKEQSASS